MKYFLIFLVLVSFAGLAFAAPGFTSQEIYDFSDIVAVGEVTFVNSTFSPTMNLYHIQVEKFLKNPQDSNEIIAAGSKTTSIRAGNEVFDVGDRALFFLADDIARMYPNYSGIYEVSTVSQSIVPNWDKCNIFEKNIPPDHWVFGGRNNHLHVSQENKTDDFVTGKKITISYDIFNHESVTKKVDFGMMVKNIDESESLYKFTETAYRILEPCTVYETVSWSFTPSKPANYLAEFYDLKGHTTGITIPIKSDADFSDMTPLKQFNSGIPFDEIQCKQNLILIQKYDGSPACVTEQTKTKLIEREWTKNDSPVISETTSATNTELQVDVTGQQQVRRGVTHDITVDVARNENPVLGALVRITIEDYGKDIIREFEGRTDNSGRFVFSWEIPKRFDDIETLLAYVDVTDDVSAKTVLFKFQVYCLPGESGCKVEGN